MSNSSADYVEAMNKKYPIRLFDIRLSVYNGALQCRVLEERAMVKGTSYRTADGQSIKIASMMVPIRVRDDRELTHSIWIDDESKMEEATGLLKAELVRNTQAQLDALAESLRIATSSEMVTSHRLFTY